MKFNRFYAHIIVLVTFCYSHGTYSQSQNFLDKPYLETSATYTTEVTPDQIFLNIQIGERDTKDKISIEELENKMIAALKSLNIDIDKQLTVSDLSSDFKKYFLKKTDVLKRKDYVLLVYDALTASNVAKELERIKISNISIQKTDYSELEQLKIDMREKAVLKAKKQGESLLKPLDQKLGKALFISDTGAAVNRFSNRRVSGLNFSVNSDRSENEFADIEISKIKIQISVTVYFEIM